MSTIIDSLQIEIQSSSTNAAAGIKNLAAAMGELKKNGAVGVAVKNLNNLSTALKAFTSVSSNANKISSLATSLEKLKSVGSFGSLANALTKLPAALHSLSGVNIGDLEPKLRSLATAIEPLANIKGSGFTSLVKGLGNVAAVTNSLDDDTIAAFAGKVEKLSTALAPLSSKLATVQSAMSTFNSKARSAASATSEMSEGVNSTTLNMSSFISVATAAAQAMQKVVDLMTRFLADAIEWDGISSRFVRGFGDSAKETYTWVQRLNEEMGINIQQFMQYSSIYANMLTGFGVESKDAAKMALGYTELTYDIWAGYNDIYKTYADAAEAVKSAIAGEVEPIRRAGFTIIESTLQQTAANYGLEISLANATEAEKSYLRYLTLVDQAHTQSLVGTYARELNTAEGAMRTLSQQVKSLAQAFGSLFLPILMETIPWAQAFVEVVTAAIHAIAALFGITIQGIDWGGMSSGVGDVTESTDNLGESLGGAASAAKDLKKATLGLDELNVISPPSEAGGGGGGGGAGGSPFGDLDIESLWDESIFANIQDEVERIKQALEDWMPVIEAVALALAALGIMNLLNNIGTAISQMGTLQKVLATLAVATIEAALVFHFADNYLEEGGLLNLVGEALVTAGAGYILFKGFGGGANGMKGAALAMAVSVAAQIAAITMNLADGGVQMDDPELWIQTVFTALTGAAGGAFFFKGITSIGAKKGALLGASFTLALTLAGITIGDIANSGEVGVENVLTGAASSIFGGLAAGGLFKFLGLASGGTGFLIGAAVMLSINVIGGIVAAVNADVQQSIEEALAERFGEIELTIPEAKAVVEGLLPEWAEGVKLAVDLYADLEQSEKNITAQLSSLEQLNWKVSIGLELTENEQETYKRTIDGFIANVQSYVEKRGYAMKIALEATAAPESVKVSSENITSAVSGILSGLGKELQGLVNGAFEDGLLDIDEAKLIQEVQSKITKIYEIMAGSDVQATIDMFKMEFSGVELTPDSYKNMENAWEDILENEIKPNLESTTKENLKNLQANVALAKYLLEEDPGNTAYKKMLTEAETALQDYIDSNPLDELTAEAELQYEHFKFNTYLDAFREDMEIFNGALHSVFDESYNNASAFYLSTKGRESVGGFVSQMQSTMLRGIEEMDISDGARKAISAMLEDSIPRFEELTSAAAKARATGKGVPAEVRKGLTDIYTWMSMSNDVSTQMEGITYLMGEKLSTDPTFLALLGTAEGAAIAVNTTLANGLMNNLTVVEDAARGTVTFLKDGIEITTLEVTPELVSTMDTLGYDLSDSLRQSIADETPVVQSEAKTMGEELVNGTESGLNDKEPGLITRFQEMVTKVINTVKSWFGIASPSKVFEGIGAALADGLWAGVQSRTSALLEKLKGWAQSIADTVKGWFGIASPSKKFKEIGGYLNDGLVLGFADVNTIVAPLKDMWNKAKTWWNNSKSGLSTYTPNIGSIYEKMKDRWDNARTWWNSKKTKASEYTPSIGSIYEKLSDRWSNAKEWWNKKKGSMSYTPSIGSITDKLKSAWNSAKSWWNKNVSLNTKLNVQVPTIKVKWDTATAFGKSFKYPTGFSLKFAADGGIFKQGSLVWAGERGAEIVANAGGGRTGVMNIEQMQEAMYESVYSAIMAAQRQSEGGGQAINIFIDGKEVAYSVEKHQRERGATIMGNEVYTY